MTGERTDYEAMARNAALDVLRDLEEEIVEAVLAGERPLKCARPLEEELDERIHEHIDGEGELDLLEAAHCLDDLSDWEETDEGLWQGLEPRKAVAAQAFYTLRNAAMSMAQDVLDEIDDDEELTDAVNALEATADDGAGEDPDGEPMSDVLARMVIAAINGEDGTTWGMCCDRAQDEGYRLAELMRDRIEDGEEVAGERYAAVREAAELVARARVRAALAD